MAPLTIRPGISLDDFKGFNNQPKKLPKPQPKKLPKPQPKSKVPYNTTIDRVPVSLPKDIVGIPEAPPHHRIDSPLINIAKIPKWLHSHPLSVHFDKSEVLPHHRLIGGNPATWAPQNPKKQVRVSVDYEPFEEVAKKVAKETGNFLKKHIKVSEQQMN